MIKQIIVQREKEYTVKMYWSSEVTVAALDEFEAFQKASLIQPNIDDAKIEEAK